MVPSEDVKDDPEFIAAHQDTKFKSTIRVYELLGAEVNLHYDIADTTCTAKVNPRTTARPGDVVKFAMVFQDFMYLIKRQSRLSLTN